jgi:osmotically-inducible protein OsmY
MSDDGFHKKSVHLQKRRGWRFQVDGLFVQSLRRHSFHRRKRSLGMKKSNADYERYGMESDDWRHMDEYWRKMYGENYPREAREDYAGVGPRNYVRSDERILEDVNEQLTRHRRINATDIDVTVKNGDVILHGTVSDPSAARLAEDVTAKVPGVRSVRNELQARRAA